MSAAAEQHPTSQAAADTSERHGSNPRNLSVSFDPENQQRHLSTTYEVSNSQQDVGRRRSSFADRVHAFRTAGGPNSLDAFARSWQRAAAFHEILPARKRSFMYVDGAEEEATMPRGEIDTSPMTQRSLLREQLERESGTTETHAGVFDDEDHVAPDSADLEYGERSPLLRPRPSRPRGNSIFRVEPQLASPFGGSYGSTWASQSPHIRDSAVRHSSRISGPRLLDDVSEPDKEHEPLLVRRIVEDDGTVVNVIIGRSTLPQTVYNSTNVLVGIGLLALPLAMKRTGWVVGLGFLTFSGGATCYTAKLLAKCADKDSSLISFADLAWIAFRKSEVARTSVAAFFCVELIGACVALVILFADSVGILLTHIYPDMTANTTTLKWGLGALMVPFVFIPLRKLSWTSVLGISCCFFTTMMVIVSGFIKPDQPGSLRELPRTTALPDDWSAVPVAIGILMSPWGGHSVFPDIYRDMRHPYRWNTSVNITYVLTLSIVLTMSIFGYLMFGDAVKEIVTNGVVGQPGYPEWIGYLVTSMIAIVPITKLPLNAKPIITVIEIGLNLDGRNTSKIKRLNHMPKSLRRIGKFAGRIGCVALIIGLAIAVPRFDRVMSLLGAVACFTICIILPCVFHLRLFWEELPFWRRVLDISLIAVSTVMGVVSVTFNFWEGKQYP